MRKPKINIDKPVSVKEKQEFWATILFNNKNCFSNGTATATETYKD